MVTICVGTVGAQVPAAPKSARVRIIDDSTLQVTVEPPLENASYFQRGCSLPEWNFETNGNFILSRDVDTSTSVDPQQLAIYGVLKADGSKPEINGKSLGHRIFALNGNDDASLLVADVTITNGFISCNNCRGGGLYNIKGTSTFIRCTFTGNKAQHSGGAIYVYKGLVNILNCVFTGGSGNTDNVVIANDIASPGSVTQCTNSDYSPYCELYYPGTTSCSNVDGSKGITCTGGEALVPYGAFVNFSTSQFNLVKHYPICLSVCNAHGCSPSINISTTCSIPTSGNVAITSDCILYSQIVVTGKLNVTGIPDAQGNLPKIIGGGSNRLFKVESGGELVVKYLNLTGGRVDETSDNGGAVHVDAATFSAAATVFSDHRAYRGGAIYGKDQANITLNHVQVQYCFATYAVGGVEVWSGTHLTVVNSVIHHNNAGADAAFLCVNPSTICIFKQTRIFENNANFENNGIGVGGTGECTYSASCQIVENSIVHDNHAADHTEGLICTNGAASLQSDAGCWTDGTSYITLPCLPGTYGTKTPTTIMNSSNWATQPTSTGTCTLCPAGKFGNLINKATEAEGCPLSCPAGKYGIASGKTTEEEACQVCKTGQFTTTAGLTICSTCNIPPEGDITVREDCIQRTQIVVTGKLNVTGIPDAEGNLPKIIGGGSNRLFKVENGGELVVKSLNLTGGYVSNTTEDGGAIEISGNGSSLNLIKSSIVGNVAGNRGGAIKGSAAAFIFIEHSTIASNRGRSGGAIHVYGNSTIVHIENSILDSNIASIHGGGISIYNGASVTIRRSILRNNTATNTGMNAGGGALWLQNDCQLVVIDCSFSRNVAETGEDLKGYDFKGNVYIINVLSDSKSLNAHSIVPKSCTDAPAQCQDTGFLIAKCFDKPNLNEGVICSNKCPPGKYGANIFACHDCPTGTYGTKAGKILETEACSSCATGRYNPSTGQTSCMLICPAGRYGKVTRASSVDEGCPNTCPLGRYGHATGKSTLEDACSNICEPGKYGSRVGQNSESDCLLCPNGHFCESDGLKSPCPLGKYGISSQNVSYKAKGYENNVCQACPASKYGVLAGQSKLTDACMNCPSGRFSLTTGLKNDTNNVKDYCPKACSSGEYLDTKDDNKCKAC
eukprot:g4709.t1